MHRIELKYIFLTVYYEYDSCACDEINAEPIFIDEPILIDNPISIAVPAVDEVAA